MNDDRSATPLDSAPHVVEEPEGSSAHDEHGTLFWISLVIGGAIMAFGVRGLIQNLRVAQQPRWFAWIIGADVVHDLLIVPLVCLIGAVVVKMVPVRWRAPIQSGLIMSAVVLALAISPLRGTAKRTGNPTIQPLNYVTATLTVLGFIWAGVAVWLVARVLRTRAQPDRA